MEQTERPEHPLLRLQKSFQDPDLGYWDNENRERIDDEREDWLIEGLLPIGASVLYADPGTGKSFLTLAMIHHLTYGRPLGPWGTDGPGRALCWVLDLEGTWRMTQDRGFALTPYGTLPQDGAAERDDRWCFWSGEIIPWHEREAWKTIPQQAQRHVRFLDQTLTEAAESGAPIHFVVIDTLTKFAGPRPRNAAGNAYEYEAALVDALNRVALRHRCALLLIHHTNKAGEISGSTGIGGSAIVTMRLDVEDQDDEDETAGRPRTAVLRSTKVRIGQPFTYSLTQRDDGVWEFIDQAPAAAVARGHARTVLFQLAEHDRGMTYADLLRATGIGNSLQMTLWRLKRARSVFYRHGRWQLAQTDMRSLPGQVDALCETCRGPLSRSWEGQRTHPGCADVAPAAEASAPAEHPYGSPDPNSSDAPVRTVPPSPGNSTEPVDNARAEQTPAFAEEAADLERADTAMAVLKQTILQSRMHPILFIKAEHRDRAPWNLITEGMTGEHRWVRPDAAQLVEDQGDALVYGLDRNGSYPSAMSSVIVVANLMHHTGAIERRDRNQAGIFLVTVPTWDEAGIGHPLGRLAERDTAQAWVSTPHVILLERLAAAGRLPAVEIHDSYTGRGTSGLFGKFSAYVRDERRRLVGTDPAAYAEMKTQTSIAIRSLWPKSTRSPFWRSDWSVSVRAEAAVRHWIRADQAVTAGATLLRLGRIDEAAFLADELPAPYQAGTGFGQVKGKTLTVDGEEWTPPYPLRVWATSVRQLRRKG